LQQKQTPPRRGLFFCAQGKSALMKPLRYKAVEQTAL
jgi:hypothetical protein